MMRGDSESSSSHAIQRGRPSWECNFFDYMRVIYRYRLLILVVCLLAGGAAGTLTYLSPERYVAEVSVVPPAETGGDAGLGLGMLGGGASFLRKMMDSSSVVDKYVGILESQAVIDALIDRFDLIRAYDKGPLRAEAKKWLRRFTSIKVSEEGILRVTVEDADPNRAAAMANAYVEELDKQNKRLSLGQVSSKRIFLEGRLKEVELKLSRIESIPSREAQVQESLYELLMRELEVAKIEEAKSMPTIQVLDPAVPPEIRKPKGTIRKAALAGIVASLLAMFFAFGREYYREYARSGMQSLGVAGRDRMPARNAANEGDDQKASSAAYPG